MPLNWRMDKENVAHMEYCHGPARGSHSDRGRSRTKAQENSGISEEMTDRPIQCGWICCCNFTSISSRFIFFYNQRTWQRHTSSDHKIEKNSIKQFTKRIFEDALAWVQGLLLFHILLNKLFFLPSERPLPLSQAIFISLYQVAGWVELNDLVLKISWVGEGKVTIFLGKHSVRKF